MNNNSKCPKCGAIEIDAMTPKTVYACGSSDYDQRPNTFVESDQRVSNQYKNRIMPKQPIKK